MKFTLSWLKDFLDTEADLDTITDTLNRIGLEVEDVSNPADALAPFLIADVLDARPHPDADKLQVCTVTDGSQTYQIVCGAPNARAGMKAVLGRPGTYVPGADITLAVRKVRGVESAGMMCSARELELGDDHDGILDLPADAPTGARYVDWAGLDDPVIEIAITPNRQDCLGVYGIARDLAAAGLGTLRPLAAPEIDTQFENPVTPVTETGDCSLFLARTFRNVSNGDSPKWLQDRLKAVGQKPISVLVDITNYISLTYARPLHVYDLDKLTGDRLTARKAAAGERFTALNDTDYEASGHETVIADGAGPQGFGGVIGGADTAVGPDTRHVVLEAALFDPVSTAMTGRAHQLITDARYRFERGVDSLFTGTGLDVASRMILDLAGGEASDVRQAGADPVFDHTVSFRPDRVRTLGGVDLPDTESVRILTGLGFSVQTDDSPWRVTVPSWRVDVDGEADLVEEILRIHGYDRIPSARLPNLDHRAGDTLSTGQRRARLSRRTLAARGLHEAVTWSFCNRKHANLFDGGSDRLIVDNPISSDLDCMRPSALIGLALAAQRNRDRGLSPSALFEVGPVYEDDSETGQRLVAAGLRAGSDVKDWRGTLPAPTVFDAKADALAVLDAAGVATDSLMIMDAPGYFHPGRSGTLRLGPKVVLATFGDLHPRVLGAMGVDGPVAAFEVFLDRIPMPRKKDPGKTALKLSNLQTAQRDFAFVISAEAKAADLIRAIRGADKRLITDVQVFDRYQGPGLDEGDVSLALAVTFTPEQATFTDAEIDAVSERVVAAAQKSVGARLRS